MEHIPSPNHGPRTFGGTPRLVVVHYTAMQGIDPVLRHFERPETQLSAHYVVGEDGRTVQMVDEDRRAWHAGIGCWGEFADVNSFSIGIELCNAGTHPFAARQMDALERLLEDVMARHAIPPEAVIGHSDSAPGRKQDPGPRFDWRRLAVRGLAVWPEGRAWRAPNWPAFRAALRRFGYTAEVDDAVLLETFRLRWRPCGLGPLDAEDMAVAGELASRWPVETAAPVDLRVVAG
ncbi:N-acetylmuramoyl-L-alanine amidase [Jannaschia sp. W003]|uniref:N-acetylmuramoyl-L-alanine amidase n=1 Tax=Jannaschia sp. W003 TaxID=2867012 RepID=UPI0021A55F3F|nr:N-acetylmuramoyl-L-alanine amidase [Jannaschia sp. W003]UWQ21330.1 N-acetylmuramoyl-L-alanine amidase [Jannaschia sp. W003]